MKQIEPVATIYTPYTTKFGIPRQSGLVETESRVVFSPPYRAPEAIRGIEGYSHLWLIWGFSEAVCDGGSLTVRPPRLGGNVRMGVFATRAPFRPNGLGLSCVKLLRVETEGPDAPVLIVSGADMLSGTPVYDVKPYLPFTDSVPDAAGGFADAMRDDALRVEYQTDVSFLSGETLSALTALLAGDPRPHYQSDPERVYAFEFAGLHIKFVCDNNAIIVKEVQTV